MKQFARFRILAGIASFCCLPMTQASWKNVYKQAFDKLPAGTVTASKPLPQWEAASASGVVFDGKVTGVGKFLIAASTWTSFNQGPILNLNLAGIPHDKVRVGFDLYTFGDWRGIQQATGGPQHRLMFFDNRASPGFSFDTCFATHADFKQAWPDRNPARHPAGTGAKALQVDKTGRFKNAHRWKIQFEYPSTSASLRFAILCGAGAGSGRSMPPFGIDNIEVSVRSTVPAILPADLPDEIEAANQRHPQPPGEPITFVLQHPGRVSIGVFDAKANRLVRTLMNAEKLPAGKHRVPWDGSDNTGKSVPEREYEWRLVTSPGLTARYVTTLGINPPGGEHPIPSHSWVGDHLGGGIVDVDASGVYIGSPITEGGRMILKANPSMSKVLWTRPQFYQSGRLTRAATSGEHVFMIHPNGKMRRLNKDNGRLEAEWEIGVDDEAPSDVDAQGKNLAASYPEKGTIRWFSTEDGRILAEANLANANCLATIESTGPGRIFVGTGMDLLRVAPGDSAEKLTTVDGDITAMDYDSVRQELWIAVDGHRVLRLDSKLRVVQTYSDQPRESGAYDPARFTGIYDIAADLKGGFYIGEPARAPRRIAHVHRDGSVGGEWFGGMSFYLNAGVDPADPTRLIGIAPEGSVNVYRIDIEKGTWRIEACYQTGRLADSMFPFTGAFRVVRRKGEIYLYHRHLPSVIRLDATLRKAVPVAIAGTVRNRGRSMVQFAGTGRDGYPRPWVAAAEFHGYSDLSKAPKFYSWADTDGNGELDPSEFRFYPGVEKGPGGVGDFLPDGDFLGAEAMNHSNAFLRLPVEQWEGPEQMAPRWDFRHLQSLGKIETESHGFGSVRALCVSDHGDITAMYQAGVMIREHGQYEGGGWPECAVKGCRVLKFDRHFQPKFTVGRQSKLRSDVNTGVLYYPMQAANGPNDSVVVNDQTKQPAQVWTEDGLYVGGVFDNRANDGLPAPFYQVHGDDNQGCTIITNANGRTCWLMPYQGHNRLYEITGWNHWTRKSGPVARPETHPKKSVAGFGLSARYFRGNQVVHETVEAPIYYERFGLDRHMERVKPHFKVEWTGWIEPPLSDRFQFHTLLGKKRTGCDLDRWAPDSRGGI